MQFRNLPLAVAVTLSAPGIVLAQDNATDLDQVVVTATRTAVTVDQSLAAVEVIDHEQITRSQATSLQELLRGRAGINLSNQGGAGKLTTLFLRGSESDHVLVLVDGIRIGSSTSGLAAFQDLPLALIDRIEIVRGPRSSLYGSEAIGGVIQVFTRRDTGAIKPRFALTAGSHDLRQVSVGIGGGSARGWYGIDAAYQRSDGINACNVATPTPWAGCFIAVPQPDRDGYRNRSLSLRGGVNATDALTFEGHALRAEGHNDYDGDFVDNSDVVQQVVGGSARWRASDAFNLQLTLGRNVDASDNFLGATPMGYFSTDRDSATLQGDVTLAQDQLLTLGLDWLHDRVDSDTVYDETARGNRAAFAQYQGRFGAQDLQAALRRDDNDQFGSHTTGSAAWGMGFGDGWRVTASYGTAFKAPTFNELYYPFFGNADLRPESSRTWEAGIAYRAARYHWRLDSFSTDVDDLIAYDASIFLPNNIDHARLRGAELGFDSSFAGWRIDASASWLDPRNRSGYYEGNLLPRRARQNARLDLDRSFGNFRIGLTGIADGARFDDLANTRRLGGYATLDVRAEYTLTPDWSLQARLANVFDRSYETAAFYNQPGRELLLTLRYAPVD
ncbi:MAG TPA: TonB-dependent vitamin B12 receptor [Luteimonas sp.]|nr:TonB-dependent vitamin B12 receptor [Luteimonas sp.]